VNSVRQTPLVDTKIYKQKYNADIFLFGIICEIFIFRRNSQKQDFQFLAYNLWHIYSWIDN